MRSAPASGYDFGNKRQYRRAVWAALGRATVKPMADCRSLVMPSSEAKEIDVALDAGIREYNLVIVDRNPAIVARVKRRFPRCTALGVELDIAAQRLRKRGEVVDIANFDLCGYLDFTQFSVLSRAAHFCLASMSAVAATWIRGRERGLFWELIKGGDPQSSRMNIVALALRSPFAAMLLADEARAGRRTWAALRPSARWCINREITRQPGFWHIAHVGSGRYQSSLPMEWAAFSRIEAQIWQGFHNDLALVTHEALRLVRAASRWGTVSQYHAARRLLAHILRTEPTTFWDRLPLLNAEWEQVRAGLARGARAVETLTTRTARRDMR